MLEKAGCQVRAMGSQGPALFPRLQGGQESVTFR